MKDGQLSVDCILFVQLGTSAIELLQILHILLFCFLAVILSYIISLWFSL